MLNRRAMLKPKDVKFKRISKTKARSLDELRDKLKEHQLAESVSTEEMSSSGQDQDQQVPTVDLGLPKTDSNRLAIVRGHMERRASFDFDSLTEPFVPRLKDS